MPKTRDSASTHKENPSCSPTLLVSFLFQSACSRTPLLRRWRRQGTWTGTRGSISRLVYVYVCAYLCMCPPSSLPSLSWLRSFPLPSAPNINRQAHPWSSWSSQQGRKQSDQDVWSHSSGVMGRAAAARRSEDSSARAAVKIRAPSSSLTFSLNSFWSCLGPRKAAERTESISLSTRAASLQLPGLTRCEKQARRGSAPGGEGNGTLIAAADRSTPSRSTLSPQRDEGEKALRQTRRDEWEGSGVRARDMIAAEIRAQATTLHESCIGCS